MSDLPRCPFTGRVADHRHHPTGRDASGRQCDPGFTFPIYRGVHVTEHVGWRLAGLDRVRGSLPALRLRRTSHLLRRLGMHVGPNGIVILTGETVAGLGTFLDTVAREIER